MAGSTRGRARSELVATVEEDSGGGDLGGQDEGLWYGMDVAERVRKLMFLCFLCAWPPNSANGLAEIENFGKKKCSMTA